MRIMLEKYESGWVGVSMELTESDIDTLISRLEDLKLKAIGHFHVRCNDFGGDVNIADIEISQSNEPGGSHEIE